MKPAAGWKKGKDVKDVDRRSVEARSSSREANVAFGRIQEIEKPERPLKVQKLDPLTDYLGCTCYHQNRGWVWFYQDVNGIRNRLTVSRFYHEIDLAIDVFKNLQDLSKEEETMISMKKTMLKAKGIRYCPVDDVNDVKYLAMVINEL